MTECGRQPTMMIVENDPVRRARLLDLVQGQAAWVADLCDLAARTPGGPVVILAGRSCAGAPRSVVRRLCRNGGVAFICVGWELESGPIALDGIYSVKDDEDGSALAALIERCRTALERPEDRSPAQPGRVTSVVSPKGGSGKTSVAINVAIALAQRSSGPVALVDCDLAYGDVAINLGLNPAYNVYDAAQCAADGGLHQDQLARFLVRHQSSGLLVLTAPTEPAYASTISADNLVTVIEMLRETCEHVVLDTSSTLNDVSVALARTVDDAIVVTGLDVSNVKNAKLGLQTMALLGVPRERLHLVVNRSDADVRLDCTAAEAALGRTPVVQIPQQMDIPVSLVTGEPVVTSEPKSSAALSFAALAVWLSADPPGSGDSTD